MLQSCVTCMMCEACSCTLRKQVEVDCVADTHIDLSELTLNGGGAAYPCSFVMRLNTPLPQLPSRHPVWLVCPMTREHDRR